MSGDRRSRRPHVSAVVPSDRTRPGHGRRYGSTGRVSTLAIARLDRRPRGAATAQADTDARRRRGTHPSPACVLPRDARMPTLGATVARSRLYFLHARGHRELRGLERALTMREILSCGLRIALALDEEHPRGQASPGPALAEAERGRADWPSRDSLLWPPLSQSPGCATPRPRRVASQTRCK
jgi:hypothetical protein